MRNKTHQTVFALYLYYFMQIGYYLILHIYYLILSYNMLNMKKIIQITIYLKNETAL